MKKNSNILQPNHPSSEAVKFLEGKSDILDTIMASMGDGLSIQDRDMRIVYQNKFMADNFGRHIGSYCYKI